MLEWGGPECSSPSASFWRGWGTRGWWTSSRRSRCCAHRDLPRFRQRSDLPSFHFQDKNKISLTLNVSSFLSFRTSTSSATEPVWSTWEALTTMQHKTPVVCHATLNLVLPLSLTHNLNPCTRLWCVHEPPPHAELRGTTGLSRTQKQHL